MTDGAQSWKNMTGKKSGPQGNGLALEVRRKTCEQRKEESMSTLKFRGGVAYGTSVESLSYSL